MLWIVLEPEDCEAGSEGEEEPRQTGQEQQTTPDFIFVRRHKMWKARIRGIYLCPLDVRHFLRVALFAPASLLLACKPQSKKPKVLQTYYNRETNGGQLGKTFDHIQSLESISGN